MTKIYNYHPITLEYLNSQNAELDPAELQINNKKVPLVPSYATLIKPQATGDYKTAIFNENSWEIVDDFRGLYMVDETMQPSIIRDLGALPEGYATATEEQATKILEDDLYYIISDGALIVNPNYEADKAAREAERVSHLKCTKREVFLALYRDKGITPEQIKEQITNPEAIIEFEYASDYYRGNPLISQIGKLLGYNDAQLDYLFENKEFPPKNNN